ncbi:adhesion G-protein coupled receptor G5 isoform X1 [Alligator mississippiensis]|uniref:adhesion G-protein coupled receptor G5 isoform X1 n=1 Tax=Alligator mississippiensis TaxID=8496 RepID=UPI0028778211|nr:adhesion G-protein coupled receptor G5 isoform X1 [Alligator mississippiensis]
MDSCLLICLLLHLRAPLLQVTEGAQLHKVINESEVKTAQQQTDAQLQKCAAVGEALKHIKILENLLLEARFCKGNFTYMASTIQTFVFSIKSRNFPGFSLSSDEQKLSKQISSSKKKGHAMSFPPALLEGVRQRTEEHRFICIYINTSCAFQNENNNTLLNNYILGATLRNTSVRNLSHPVEMRFWHDRVLDNSTATCVFWLEEAESDSRGTWSREGCKTIHERHMVLCQCNHLTYFAVLLQNSSEDINENLLAPLTYITIIGCSISAAASLLTILLYLVSRKKKGDNTTKIHMNLLGGLFFLNGFFLLSEPLASFNLMWLCRTAAVFLHYSLLCCFTWMAIEGFHLYLLLIKVYNVYIRRYIHKLCMLGWGLPAIIVIGILIAKKEVYGFHQIKTSGHNYTATMCWITSKSIHYFINLSYAGVTMLFNIVVLVIVLRMLRNIPSQKERARRDIVTVLGLTCLLGTTWAFAFLSFGVFLTFQIFLFTIINSLHGFFICLWYCTIHRKVDGGFTSETLQTTK